MTPKFRESLYYIGAAVPAILGLALVWGGIDQGAADNLGGILAGLVNMLGAAAPATAAVKVNQQRKDGTLDNLSPAEQVEKSVQAAADAAASANADLDRVKQVITGAAGYVPGMGPLAQQVIAAQHPQPLFASAHNTEPDIWRGQRF